MACVCDGYFAFVSLLHENKKYMPSFFFTVGVIDGEPRI